MITDVPGVKVGHWTSQEALTGCTVILPPDGTVGSVDLRGGAPGTREYAALLPEQRVNRVHGLVLSGGSAFGLATADGVMGWLEERGIGWEVGDLFRVPIVPAAILLDLGMVESVRPGAAEGRMACDNATDGPFETGSVGAGTGCTCGKQLGLEWGMKSGLGTATVTDGDLIVSAIVAANPVGDILDEGNEFLAGSRAPEGTQRGRHPRPGENTMIGAVVTNAQLTKNMAMWMARGGQDGIAMVIRPPHTRYDGDIVFGLATGALDADPDLVISLASTAMANAVRQGARAAKGTTAFPGLADD